MLILLKRLLLCTFVGNKPVYEYDVSKKSRFLTLTGREVNTFIFKFLKSLLQKCKQMCLT